MQSYNRNKERNSSMNTEILVIEDDDLGKTGIVDILI